MITMSDVLGGDDDSGMDLFDKMSLMENATTGLIKTQEGLQEEKQAANHMENKKTHEVQGGDEGKELKKVCMF